MIEVKSMMFLRAWLFLATGGAFIVGVWLVSEALTFESKYALLYLGGGLLAMIYGLITFFMAFPAFTSRGNVIFTIKTGPSGEIFSRKRSVLFSEVKRLYMGRHQYSLKGIFFEDIIIAASCVWHVSKHTDSCSLCVTPSIICASSSKLLPHSDPFPAIVSNAIWTF